VEIHPWLLVVSCVVVSGAVSFVQRHGITLTDLDADFANGFTDVSDG
jgi:Na+-translocating ferredoxin:NAD+ oxidoreductase RnfE subunit